MSDEAGQARGGKAEIVELRRGRYADSVALMRVSQQVTAAIGVSAALVAMATELNLEILESMGFALPEQPISPNDLLVAVRAENSAAADAAAKTVDALLDTPSRPGPQRSGGEITPRTVSAAARQRGPGLALISVPGRFAFAEAMDALDAGCDVMIFSDNVSLDEEISLKRTARERNLLVMGPDCGTAVVNGIGLGFSHTVDSGPLGIVAASGTGAQQVICLLDAAGLGVSAVLGVGGRDQSEAVGGMSTLAAMDLLDTDPGTDRILVLSKPPGGAVAGQLRQHAEALATPVIFGLLGPGLPDLTHTAEVVLTAYGISIPKWPSQLHHGAASNSRNVQARHGDAPRFLRGLYTGGTLCDEAMLIATDTLGPVRSNIPLSPELALDASHPSDSHRPESHWMIDFGDDLLTRGRAHPMIDPSLRNERLRAALADQATGAVLLDVVLGHGAHPDPVAGIVEVIDGAEMPVIVTLVGARRDPQSFDGSWERLGGAGASVFASNAAAARYATGLVSTGGL